MAYGYAPNTIMSKVLTDVYQDKNNEKIIDRIDEIVDKIEEGEYEDYDEILTNEYISIINQDEKIIPNSKIVLRTEYPYEISWLFEELYDVYEVYNGTIDEIRFYDTIAHLAEIYEVKARDEEDLLRFVATVSVILLHPDHIIKDKFKVHPIKLPPFGKEF